MKNLIFGLLLVCFVLWGTVNGKPASKDSVKSVNAFKLNRFELPGSIALGFEKNDVRAGAFFGFNLRGKYFEFTNVKIPPYYYLSYSVGFGTTFRNLIFDLSFGPEMIVNDNLFFRFSLGYWKILVNKTSREFGFNLAGETGFIMPLSGKIGVKLGAGIRFFTEKIENPLAFFSIGLVF